MGRSDFIEKRPFFHKKFQQIFYLEKLNNWAGVLLFTLVAGIMGFLMANYPMLGISVTGLVVAAALGLVCLFNPELALYTNLVYAFFIAHFDRMLFNDSIQEGVFSDILVGISFLSLFISRVSIGRNFQQLLKTSVVISLLILYSYMAIELFNPYARFFSGWFPGFRKTVSLALILFIAYSVLDSRQRIKRYIKILFVLCFAVALYACIQQWYGFFSFEYNWLMQDPRRYRMTFLSGGIRRMSTMPDALSLSIIMATCSVFFLSLANEFRKFRNRVFLLGGVTIMVLAMGYTVTRTANAMLAGGLFMYLILTLQKKSTQILALVSFIVFVTLLYGPFYNSPQIRAFKQTFQGSKDASFNVREANRKSVQPYIYRHPIGGGLGTTGDEGKKYNPGHPLAGFPPDSGSLRKALEMGWIGFGIICFVYFLVLRTGIRAYFESTNPESKAILAAATATCFSFYIGDFAQVAIGQITDIFVYYPLIAIILRLRNLDQTENDKLAYHASENT